MSKPIGKGNKGKRFTGGQQQRGAILVFCLVFMAVLTMMGVSGMEATTLEERMSGNMVDHEVAFNSAETALQAAEAWLLTQTNLPITSADGSTTVWAESAMDPADDTAGAGDGLYWWDHANVDAWNWWTNNGIAVTNVALVADNPRYLIEEYRAADTGQSLGIGGGEQTNPRVFHRITARGVGINATTTAAVQSTFVQTYD